MTRDQWARRPRRESFAKRHPALAARVYFRDRATCRWCRRRVGSAFHFDHVRQKAHGGRDTLSNVVLACPACNCRRNTPRGIRTSMSRSPNTKSPKKTVAKKAAVVKKSAKTKTPKKAAKTSKAKPIAKPIAKAKPMAPKFKAAPAPTPAPAPAPSDE